MSVRRGRLGSRRWTVAQARRRWGVGPARLRRVLIVAAMGAGLIALDRLGFGGAFDDDLKRYDGRAFVVVHVVDGDTLDIAAADGDRATTRVRLWGINTPELAKPWEAAEQSQPGAEEAKAALTRWSEHRVVVLELLPHRVRDDFGRLLAYVHDPAWGDVNRLLVETGHAHADDRWWHPRAPSYAAAETAARRSSLGIWAKDR